MLNPVDVERRFMSVQHLLVGHLSFRHQWFIISEFLESVRGRFETYDTHCEQLAAQLPVFSHPLSVTGTDPARLISILDLLSDLEQVVPEIKEAGDYHKAKESLKVAIAFLYICLSEYNSAANVLSVAVDSADYNYKSPEEYFRRIKTSDKYSFERSFQRRVDKIHSWWQIANKPKKNSLYVPVVETEDDSQKLGRIRKLSASVMGRQATNDQFRNSYSVIGAEGQDAGLSPIIKKTTRHLINLSHPDLEQDFFEVQFDYQMSFGVQKGRSAELASSLTAYTTILDNISPRETYALKNGVAVTGQLLEDSVIGPVEQASIEQKVKAAFFSWIDILVVPDLQKKIFTDHRDRLKEQYPAKVLIIIGLDKPEAYFYDRRLSNHQKNSMPVHAAKQVWENKFSAAGIVVILLLMTALGRLMYGPIDKNPEIGIFSGEELMIYNGQMKQLISFDVGSSDRSYNEVNNSNSAEPQVQFYDINKDGINEIFWYQAQYEGISNYHSLKAWSMSGDSLIWERPLIFDVKYPRQNGIVENQYLVQELQIVENKLGDSKLVANTNLFSYFPAIISTFNTKNGEPDQQYAHPGYFFDIAVHDVTGDGVPEVLATGVNNALLKSVLTVLSVDDLQGHAPTQGDYLIGDMNLANHIHYIQIPKTIVGQNHGSASRYNYGKRIDILPDSLISLSIADSQTPLREGGLVPSLVITMNNYFQPIGIGTDDRYDVLAQQLYKEGEIPFVPGFEYFEAFKDSLLYWDGEERKFMTPR